MLSSKLTQLFTFTIIDWQLLQINYDIWSIQAVEEQIVSQTHFSNEFVDMTDINF